MADLLDLRGLSCPIPLMKVRETMDSSSIVEVLVDDPCAQENIIKYAKSQGYKVTEAAAGKYEITLRIEKS